MPYIITTRDAIGTNQSKHIGEDGELRYDADDSEVFPGATGVRPSIPTTRRAVATLGEANDATLESRRTWYWPLGKPRRAGQPPRIGPDGGTIGPLPDGTEVEVEQISEAALLNAIRPSLCCPTCGIQRLYVSGSHLIDAYNEANG